MADKKLTDAGIAPAGPVDQNADFLYLVQNGVDTRATPAQLVSHLQIDRLRRIQRLLTAMTLS